MEHEEKDRVEDNVQDSSCRGCKEGKAGRTLGIDKRGEAQREENRRRPGKIGRKIGHRIGERHRASPAEGKERAHQRIEDRHEGDGEENEEVKAAVQDAVCLIGIFPSKCHGKEGRAASPDKGCEGGDQDDNGIAETDACKGCGADIPDVADVDPVHDGIEEVYELRRDLGQGHREHEPGNGLFLVALFQGVHGAVFFGIVGHCVVFLRHCSFRSFTQLRISMIQRFAGRKHEKKRDGKPDNRRDL